jgi:hypothetical protein
MSGWMSNSFSSPLASSDVWRIYGSILKIWRNLEKTKSKVVIRHLNLTGGGRLNPTDLHYVANIFVATENSAFEGYASSKNMISKEI